MEFPATIRGRTACLRVKGMLITRNRDIFKENVAALFDKPISTLIIDLRECSYVDAAGLGMLVSINFLAHRNSKHVFVQNLSDDLRTLLELTQLDALIEVAPADQFKRKCHIVAPNFDEINREVMEYIGNHPESLHGLSWRRFEELLDAVFRNQGFRTILGTGSADGGIDLRLIHSDVCGELLTLVQAKRYRDAPIRLEAVQAFCAAMDDEKANRGLFVTTSRYLPVAQRFAARQRHRLVLADSEDVARWCQQAARHLSPP